MRRVSAIGITGHWGALMVALMVAGCGSFNPPPPPELATLPDARSADSRTLIEVLPSSTPNPERDRWLQAIRVEAGMSRITLLETPEPSGAAPACARIASEPRRRAASKSSSSRRTTSRPSRPRWKTLITKECASLSSED